MTWIRCLRAAAWSCAAVLFVGACTSSGNGDSAGPTGGEGSHKTSRSAGQSPAGTSGSPDGNATSTTTGGGGSSHQVAVAGAVASDLEVPWGIGFLPDGRALITERDRGTISVVDPEGTVTEIGRIDETSPTAEGGLLGLAVSPEFGSDGRVFVYVTTSTDNRVLSMRFDGETLSDVHAILTGIPAGEIHDGGQLRFGPDGYLYVSTGETGDDRLAQDPESLGGKILRVTASGQPAPGNPDPGSPVWTLGHRNVQGLTFDDRDQLWASEFGSQVWDEVNRIERGNNYGWPIAEGKANVKGYVDPSVEWRPDEASPSSIAYADGSLWVASLRGVRLWEIPLSSSGGTGSPIPYFVEEYGRLRAVVAAPDGSLWVTTSNRDGRGDPQAGDDKILRVTLH